MKSIPFELRAQIGGKDWDSLTKTEQLRAIAWAMESILMSDTKPINRTECNKIKGLNVIRRKVLKDYINDKEVEKDGS